MPAKTKNFNQLRDQARRSDPDWDAGVLERQQAMEDAVALAQLRQSRHVTQVQLAEHLGITQGNVSRLEGRGDIYLSTLRSYIQALGGHLEIAAVFDDQRVPCASPTTPPSIPRPPDQAKQFPHRQDQGHATVTRDGRIGRVGFTRIRGRRALPSPASSVAPARRRPTQFHPPCTVRTLTLWVPTA